MPIEDQFISKEDFTAIMIEMSAATGISKLTNGNKVTVGGGRKTWEIEFGFLGGHHDGAIGALNWHRVVGGTNVDQADTLDHANMRGCAHVEDGRFVVCIVGST